MSTDKCPKMTMMQVISVIESASGFTDETTPVGESWAFVCAELTRLRAENADLRERLAGAYVETLEARAHLSNVYDKSKFDADQAILRAIEKLEPTQESEGV